MSSASVRIIEVADNKVQINEARLYNLYVSIVSLSSNFFFFKDISDLFGADLPVEGERSKRIQFAWRDGPFLKALRGGHWIVLDEVIYTSFVEDS